MKMIYPAVFYPYSDGSGGYVVEFPDLPGCVTGGKNLQEAIEMATDAAWQNIEAVRNGEVVYLDSSYFGISANLKVIEGLDILSDIVHGDGE